MPYEYIETVKITGFLAILLGTSAVQAADIEVQLQKLTSNATAYAALNHAEQKEWSQQPLQAAKSDDGKLLFKDVPPGRYAVQIFVDNNGNGRLDSSKLGIPREPVGFSNNPSLFEGQPSPERTGFDHATQNTVLQVKLHSPRRALPVAPPASEKPAQ